MIRTHLLLKLGLLLFGYAMLTMVVFFPLFRGETLYCCDNLLINLPARTLLFEELSNGRFPLWNPYILSGTPFLADINIGSLYPGIFIEFIASRFFPILQVLSWSILVHVYIAMVGMYWCSRELKLSHGGAFLSSIIYALSGTFLTYTGNIPMIQVAAWFPWVFGCIVLITNAPTRRLFVITVVLATIQFVAGHPQLSCLSWLVYGAYGIVFAQKRNVLLILGLLVCTMILASIQLIPFIELATQSSRVGSGWEYSTQGSFPLFGLIRLVFPSVVGDLAQGTDWWQGGSMYGYVGVLSFALAIRAINKEAKRLFFGSVAIIGLLAALGSVSPVYWLFYYFIPGVSLFRVPSHFLFLTTIATAILAGWGIDEVMKRNITLVIVASVGCCIGLMLYLSAGLIHTHVYQLAWSIKQSPKFLFLGESGFQLIIQQIGLNMLFVCLSFYCFYSSVQWKKAILIILIVLDLSLVSQKVLLTESYEKVNEWLSVSKQTSSYFPDNEYRIWIHPSVYPSHNIKTLNIPYYPLEVEWQAEMLRSNLGILFHKRTVDGYSSIVTKQYQNLFRSTSQDPTGVNIGGLDNPMLNDLSVRYVLIPRNESYWTLDIKPALSTPQFIRVKENSSFIVLENTFATPRTKFIANENEAYALPPHGEYPGYIRFEMNVNQSGTITINEFHYPGWHVFVNQQRAHLLPGDVLSVHVDSGRQKVEFIYTPTTFIFGIAVSLLGVCICAIILFNEKTIFLRFLFILGFFLPRFTISNTR